MVLQKSAKQRNGLRVTATPQLLCVCRSPSSKSLPSLQHPVMLRPSIPSRPSESSYSVYSSASPSRSPSPTSSPGVGEQSVDPRDPNAKDVRNGKPHREPRRKRSFYSLFKIGRSSESLNLPDQSYPSSPKQRSVSAYSQLVKSDTATSIQSSATLPLFSSQGSIINGGGNTLKKKSSIFNIFKRNTSHSNLSSSASIMTSNFDDHINEPELTHESFNSTSHNNYAHEYDNSFSSVPTSVTSAPLSFSFQVPTSKPQISTSLSNNTNSKDINDNDNITSIDSDFEKNLLNDTIFPKRLDPQESNLIRASLEIARKNTMERNKSIRSIRSIISERSRPNSTIIPNDANKNLDELIKEQDDAFNRNTIINDSQIIEEDIEDEKEKQKEKERKRNVRMSFRTDDNFIVEVISSLENVNLNQDTDPKSPRSIRGSQLGEMNSLDAGVGLGITTRRASILKKTNPSFKVQISPLPTPEKNSFNTKSNDSDPSTSTSTKPTNNNNNNNNNRMSTDYSFINFELPELDTGINLGINLDVFDKLGINETTVTSPRSRSASIATSTMSVSQNSTPTPASVARFQSLRKKRSSPPVSSTDTPRSSHSFTTHDEENHSNVDLSGYSSYQQKLITSVNNSAQSLANKAGAPIKGTNGTVIPTSQTQPNYSTTKTSNPPQIKPPPLPPLNNRDHSKNPFLSQISDNNTNTLYDASMDDSISFNPCVHFSSKILVFDTFNPIDYDRTPEVATCNQLTPFLAAQIRNELNELKREWPIHPDSMKFTHFY